MNTVTPASSTDSTVISGSGVLPQPLLSTDNSSPRETASPPTPSLSQQVNERSASNQLQSDDVDLQATNDQQTSIATASVRVSTSLGKGSSALNMDATTAAELYREIEGML